MPGERTTDNYICQPYFGDTPPPLLYEEGLGSYPLHSGMSGDKNAGKTRTIWEPVRGRLETVY